MRNFFKKLVYTLAVTSIFVYGIYTMIEQQIELNNIADEKEIAFYCEFDIAPLGMLSECMYDNEFRLGVSYGNDVCLHLEDTEKSSCKDCENGQSTKLYYPVITDFIIINFFKITVRIIILNRMNI